MIVLVHHPGGRITVFASEKVAREHLKPGDVLTKEPIW